MILAVLYVLSYLQPFEDGKINFMNSIFCYLRVSPFSLKAFVAVIAFCISAISIAQPDSTPMHSPITEKPVVKPYKILTSGRHITIQSNKDIARIMVWTSSGNRFVEQNNVNAPSYSFNITIRERFYFMLLEFKDGKRYTDKFGVE
jgi:hypothetical protein